MYSLDSHYIYTDKERLYQRRLKTFELIWELFGKHSPKLKDVKPTSRRRSPSWQHLENNEPFSFHIILSQLIPCQISTGKIHVDSKEAIRIYELIYIPRYKETNYIFFGPKQNTRLFELDINRDPMKIYHEEYIYDHLLLLLEAMERSRKSYYYGDYTITPNLVDNLIGLSKPGENKDRLNAFNTKEYEKYISEKEVDRVNKIINPQKGNESKRNIVYE